MSTVDPLYAQWLMAEALWQSASAGVVTARWGSTAQTKTKTTTIATRADAKTEAERQLAFLSGSGPLVVDEHQVPGVWGQYLGRVITLTINQLGYDNGLDVFVIGAEDNRATGLSTLTVIRRL